MTRAASIGAPRRGLRRAEAAAYVGLPPTTFDVLVHEGRMPPPIRIPGHQIVVWDVRDLDDYFDRWRDGPAPSGTKANAWDGAT